MTFMPRVSLTKLIASSISKPLELASKFATAGAIVGSRQSRSNVISFTNDYIRLKNAPSISSFVSISEGASMFPPTTNV